MDDDRNSTIGIISVIIIVLLNFMMEIDLFFGLLAVLFGINMSMYHLVVDYFNLNLVERWSAEDLQKKHPNWDLGAKYAEYMKLKKRSRRLALRTYNNWLEISWSKRIDMEWFCFVILMVLFAICGILSLVLPHLS